MSKVIFGPGVPLLRWACAVLLAVVAVLLSPPLDARAATVSTFAPGAAWNDQNGNQLQMHGLGIVKSGGTWYGFGEDKNGGESAGDAPFRSIPCFSSTDLRNWTFRSSALPRQAGGDLGPDRVVERPKVVYNASTSTYVMYLHIDDPTYAEAKVGVATSATPCGPYTYRGSFRPLGFESRDESLFQDTDGSAYLLTEDRAHGLRVERLSSDYLSVASGVALLPGYESPAMMKSGGRYFILGSHLTGWNTNDNVYASATSLGGPWTPFTNFAPAGTATYNTQTANIIQVSGSAGTTYVYAGDRWNPADLGSSRMVWLPITVSGPTLNVGWFGSWSLDVSAGTWSADSSVPGKGTTSSPAWAAARSST